MIAAAVLEEIQARTDIVEVIGAVVVLKPGGREFKGLCPFHQEKTPSFTVSREKQVYYCFGCGAGGNVFTFLMQYQGLEFPQAVERLAQRANVVLPAPQRGEERARSGRDRIVDLNARVAAAYHRVLASAEGVRARAYLAGRGVGEEVIETFALGYAPGGWDFLTRWARTEQVAPAQLVEAGLVVPRDGGGCYDRFRDRVMFPIRDDRGRIVAFGGRVLEQGEPKYLNSPETPVYTKGLHLYGLDAAARAIREADEAVLVEGYLDLLVGHQFGFRNVVAPLGTALTESQVRRLGRLTRRVILALDPDPAGESAALRGLEACVQEGLSVRVARLPAGCDPADVLLRHGAARFREALEGAEDVVDYSVRTLGARWGTATIEAKVRIVAACLPVLARVPNEVERSEHVRRLAEALTLDEDAVRAELRKARAAGEPPRAGAPTPVPLRPVKQKRLAEAIVAGILLEEPERVEALTGALHATDFADPGIRLLMEQVFAHAPTPAVTGPSGDRWWQRWRTDQQLGPVVAEVVVTAGQLMDRDTSFWDSVRWLQRERLRRERASLHEALRAAEARGDGSRVLALAADLDRVLQAERGLPQRARAAAEARVGVGGETPPTSGRGGVPTFCGEPERGGEAVQG